MGKKRIKGKIVPDDDSSESLEPMCRHIRKGLEQGILKKALVNVEWNICQDCKTDNKVKDKSEEEAEENPSVWLCLKCGHQGCSRNSQEQHALKHYLTPRSEPHCLVLNLDNWSVWCYLCDDEVQYCSSNRLGQVVDYVRKQAGITAPESAAKDNGNIELENKKLEKENKNEQEREKKENMAKETSMNFTSQISVKGLSNLGNTCFFNAVMQNLSQTPVLRELLKEVKMSGTIVKIEPPDLSLTEPLEIHLEPPGPLTLAMSQFLSEMQETSKGVVTPKELFSQVCKKAVRFKGYQQQDSQELLRYLLDGMRAEEHQRVSKGILKAFGNSTEKLDEELKNKVKDYEKRKSVPSFVDRIFGGELTSTIMCDECRTVSLVHESFLDLSLPVLDDQSGKKSINDKNLKKTMENDDKDSEEEKDNDTYMKERNDIPSGISKHLQKKAKKQAKKQAKNQRRQQKIQGKVLHLNDDVCALDHLEDNECEAEMSVQGEVDIKSNHISQEEVISKEYCVNPNDLNGQEKMIENVTDNQKFTEDVDVTSVSVENDLEVLPSSPTDCPGSLNGAFLDAGGGGEVDISRGFRNLHLDAALHPDDIHLEILNGSPVPGTTLYECVGQDPETAFCTLANRDACSADECSIQHCLYQFTQNEKLRDANKLLCDVCTRRQCGAPKANLKGEKKHVYTDAKKQMLISLAPPVLTLHLKRFQQAGFNLRKINKHIKFPEILDLAPFCTAKCKNVAEESTRVLYSLYGVVEHSGTMRSGHYTAYAKARMANSRLSDLVLRGDVPQDCEMESTKGQWFHISDSHVQAVPTAKVLNSQAYLLFYERI